MDDLLPRDFVYRSQAKAAPMAASKSTTTTTPLNFGIGSDSEIGRSSSSSRVRSSSGWNSASFLDDQDSIFGSKPSTGYDDVFGGPPKYSSSKPSASPSSFDYDSFFQKDTKAPTPSSPVYDKPVYDDEMDIFDGVQGVKSSSKFDDVFTINSPPKRNEKSSRYEDVFSGVSSPPKQKDDYDDLLGNFGRKVSESSSSRKKSGDMDKEKKMSSFDDLLPGFGGSSPNNRSTPEASGPQQPTVPRTKSPSSIIEDPFVVLESAPGPAYASSGLFTESLEPTDRPRKSGSTNSDVPSARRGLNDDMDPLGDLGKSVPKFSSDTNNRAKDRNSSRTGINMTSTHHSVGEEQTGRTFVETDEIVSRRKAPTEDYRDSHQTLFDMPTVSSDSNKAFDRNGSRSYVTSPGTNSQFSPKFEDNSGASDDVWLTVSEIPLFTQPTSAPQPSRPPPPRPTQGSKTVKGPFSASNSKKVNEFSSYESISQTSRRPEPVSESAKSSGMSSMDELEEFAKAKRRSNADELGDSLSSEEEIETNSTAATSAAAMKKAVDLAEAKFKHAREVRERENAKGAKTRGQQEREEKVMPDVQERELREKQERLDREREQREREEKESEQRKFEKERERARELEKEKNRQAVERATKEARERAATEARLKAERAQAEKAKAEALERSQRQAVQRAHAEARKRLAAEAREKAERAAAEARERAAAEARERANAEAREKANAEAREKANAEARRRADKPTATAEPRAGRGSQKNENDLESFFGGMANRPSSAPKGRTTSTDSTPQFHTRTGPEGSQGPSSAGTSSGINRTFSTPNIVDDLTSIFGGMPSSGDFQDIEGETEERRRARLERHQRTQDRAKLALAAKNDRDLKAQREQEERHRISETLDVEIKRWAAGKEGNLRALLSTLQYVLWKECGWQAVSLTDLITGASVKKVYRKATLCIHPDKVQQKGANLQQKYIAEKVFDLLKEAWNKFNSEELF